MDESIPVKAKTVIKTTGRKKNREMRIINGPSIKNGKRHFRIKVDTDVPPLIFCTWLFGPGAMDFIILRYPADHRDHFSIALLSPSKLHQASACQVPQPVSH
jgi:hypothetical protein